jgi:hypothetical protein
MTVTVSIAPQVLLTTARLIVARLVLVRVTR